MSTVGKVLVAFVTLLLIAWLMLLSMVAQLNSNWGEAIAKQETQIQSLQEQVAKTRDDLAQAKADLVAEQLDRENDVIVLRAQVADRERALTDMIERLERVTIQVEGQQEALRVAEIGKTRRIADVAQTTKSLEEARAEVERLMANNRELMAQLDQLREDFKELLQENQSLVGRSSPTAGLPALPTSRVRSLR